MVLNVWLFLHQDSICVHNFLYILRLTDHPSYKNDCTWHNNNKLIIIMIRCCYYHSAGIGQTGAFIAIDIELQRIKQEGVVDVYNTVCKLRHNRKSTIQTLVIHKGKCYCLTCNIYYRLSICLCLMLLWSSLSMVIITSLDLLMLLKRNLKSWLWWTQLQKCQGMNHNSRYFQ